MVIKRSSKANIAAFLAIIVFAFNSLANAANGGQEPIGARPVGMGSTFVGIADDGNSLYWNPAGMAFMKHHEITSTYSDLFGLGISNNYVSYVLPISGKMAIGIDWFNMGFGDTELEYNLNKANFGTAYKITNRFSIGGLLKYLNTNTEFDQQSMGKGNGWTGDIGAFCRVNNKLSAGFVVNNLFDGNITYDNGTVGKYYDMRTRLGMSYRPVENGLLAMDIGDRLHLGSEYTHARILSLRFGLERDLEGEKETELSFGTGIKYKMLQFDYAYRYHPHLDGTSLFSASVFFNFGYSLVDVKNTMIANNQGLFPSLWKQYASQPFIEFELENKDDKPLKCSWSVELQDLLGEPSAGEVILRPYEKQTISVAGSFSEKFLAIKSDNFKSGKIKVKYQRDRSTKEFTQNFQTFIFSRGAIDWNTDMNWIGSFINPDDPEIREVAVEATDYIENKGYINASAKNIIYAMAIFNSLKSRGLKYLPDPNRPYQRVGDENAPVDNIQYPVELLNSGAGDCDDITALMCSLLESIGIRTVVLDVPGHLFMMFDTGIPEMYALSLMLDRENTVIYDGNIFVPLEITELEGGFMKAWQFGSAACNRWLALEELNMIDIHSSWDAYTPVPINIQRRSKEIDSESWWSAVDQDMGAFKNKQQEFLNVNYALNIKKVRDKAIHMNELAMAALMEGDVARCLASLKEAWKLDSDNTGITMNLANAYAMEGEFAQADKLYSGIKGPDSIIMAVRYNKIIVYCLMSEDDKSLPDQLLPTMHEYLEQYDDPSHYTYVESKVNRCIEAENIFGDNLAECIKEALAPPDKSRDELPTKAGILEAGQPGKQRWFLWYGLNF